jgi:hypothetical protein
MYWQFYSVAAGVQSPYISPPHQIFQIWRKEMTPKGSGHQFVVHEVQDSGFRVPVPERTFQHFLISSENLLHSGAVFPSVPQEIEFNILRIKIKFGLLRRWNRHRDVGCSFFWSKHFVDIGHGIWWTRDREYDHFCWSASMFHFCCIFSVMQQRTHAALAFYWKALQLQYCRLWIVAQCVVDWHWNAVAISFGETCTRRVLCAARLCHFRFVYYLSLLLLLENLGPFHAIHCAKVN